MIRRQLMGNARIPFYSTLFLPLLWLNGALAAWEDRGEDLRFVGPNYELKIEKKGFRFSLHRPNGETIVGPHKEAGLTFRDAESEPLSPAASTRLLSQQGNDAVVEITCENGRQVRVEIMAAESYVRVLASPAEEADSPSAQKPAGYDLDLQLAGELNPAYGLGDHGGYTGDANLFGFRSEVFQHQMKRNMYRFISTFCLFPRHRLGQVVFSRDRKFVQIDENATVLGVRGAQRAAAWYWFVGEIPEIYAQYKAARTREGFGDRKPRYEFFGVGFEGYGAQGWTTTQETVQKIVQEYLDRGYPLSWAVVSSGRWRNPQRVDRTKPEGDGSSFGLWGERYPDPESFKRFFKERDIQFITGVRQIFVGLERDGGIHDPEIHGPFSRIGVERGYFLANADGKPRTFRALFPKGSVYFLDPDNPEAVKWYVEQHGLWGSQGIKEDVMFHAPPNSYYDDGKHNRLLEAFDDAGYLVLVRNAAYGVPGSILRVNDAGIEYGPEDQDRIPINLLNFAASGQPNVYPDIIGGKPIKTWDEQANRYLTRMAMLCNVCPSLSFGNAPWNMQDPALEAATLKAAKWHEAYRPYIYSAVMESYRTGYPATFTPLPVAYPDDSATYNLANAVKRQYSWLLGPSLLACPLFGGDYDTAEARDVYLPAGKWQDYETGKRYEGPTTLRNYPLPMDKMPLFVGRTGILVSHDRNGQLWGELFPAVMDGNDYVYVHRDGTTKSRITVEANASLPILNAKDFLDRVTIRNTTDGNSVAVETHSLSNAFRFRLEAGKDYQIVVR